MERQWNYALNAYMKYASEKLLQSSNVKSCSITLGCVCVFMKNEERALLLKKNGQLEIIGKRFDRQWSLKEKTICVHKNLPMRKMKALTYESGMTGEELKLFLK